MLIIDLITRAPKSKAKDLQNSKKQSEADKSYESIGKEADALLQKPIRNINAVKATK